MSAGDPWVIWVYRLLDESEFMMIFTLLSFSNCVIMSSVTCIRLDAMNTLSSVGLLFVLVYVV